MSAAIEARQPSAKNLEKKKEYLSLRHILSSTEMKKKRRILAKKRLLH